MKTLLPLRPRAAALATALFLTLGASLAHAQITIYAQFSNGTGVWTGESTDLGRAGWAKVQTVSFGAANPLNPGGGPAATTFDPVNLQKAVDRLSPQIFIQLAGGTLLNRGPGLADLTLEFVRVVNAVPATFFRVELRTVALNKTSTTGADGDDTLLESVELKGNAIRYTYWLINPDGTQGASFERAWNTVNNTPTF